MTSLPRYLFVAFLVLVMPALASTADGWHMTIGYLELEDDPRYAERTAYARIQLRSNTRPWPSAELAIEDTAVSADVVGMTFSLKHHRGKDRDELLRTLSEWREDENISFVLLDLPGELVADIAASTRDEQLLLFNVASSNSALRRGQCQPHLFHALPDDAMAADALVQYLVSRDWKRLLLLQGPRSADRRLAAALQRSAERFGATLVDRRELKPGHDPREREQNNILLLTAGEDYDAVVVAEAEGDIGRYVPYQTRRPRPVVGTAGLQPRAWSRVFERHGAPQVNDRFEQHAGRFMGDKDWAAWIAVKSIVQAAMRTQSNDFDTVAEFLRSERLRVDGAKGPALSYREWNNQLRQPMLLATHDAVIARAPIDGFLHPRENMDTLGDDAGDSTCEF